MGGPRDRRAPRRRARVRPTERRPRGGRRRPGVHAERAPDDGSPGARDAGRGPRSVPPAEGPHASAWLARALAPLGLRADDPPPPLDWSEADHQDAHLRTRAPAPALRRRAPRQRISRQELAGGPLRHGRPAALPLANRGSSSSARPRRTRRSSRARSSRGTGPCARSGPRSPAPASTSGTTPGVSHLAAASGTPTLALFGPTDPALWSPVGPGSRRSAPRAASWPISATTRSRRSAGA